MGRGVLILHGRRVRSVLPVLILAGSFLSIPGIHAAEPSTAPETFAVRMVKLGGRYDDPAVRRHVAWSVERGFNAVWVFGHQAGRWGPGKAPDGPFLHASFVELASWCRERGVRLFVSVNPNSISGGRFVFSDRDQVRRLRKFYRLLRRKAGVRDFVLSFDDQPTRLTELRDVLRFGTSTAPAHLDLVRSLEPMFRRRETFWFCSSAYSDQLIGDGGGRYSAPFLEGVGDLPEGVGLVWTGPEVVSRSITADDLRRARARFGGRKLLLYDNYPDNVNGDLAGLTLVLGPLRHRGPDLHHEAAVYLACPMRELGASRLPLMTVADYLRDPARYDADASLKRALRELAGGDEDALDALRIQVLEWGGWVGTRNYFTRDDDNVYTAVDDVLDPAALARWGYVERRYPDRMRSLAGLADDVFRDDLLERMASRLNVARALPVIAELWSGEGDEDALTARLRSIHEEALREPRSAVQLEMFLVAAGVATGTPAPPAP